MPTQEARAHASIPVEGGGGRRSLCSPRCARSGLDGVSPHQWIHAAMGRRIARRSLICSHPLLIARGRRSSSTLMLAAACTPPQGFPYDCYPVCTPRPTWRQRRAPTSHMKQLKNTGSEDLEKIAAGDRPRRDFGCLPAFLCRKLRRRLRRSGNRLGLQHGFNRAMI